MSTMYLRKQLNVVLTCLLLLLLRNAYPHAEKDYQFSISSHPVIMEFVYLSTVSPVVAM